MEILLQVNCIECDTEINQRSLHLDFYKIAKVNVSEFEQSDWECSECGHITCIGDIDMIDKEDL